MEADLLCLVDQFVFCPHFRSFAHPLLISRYYYLKEYGHVLGGELRLRRLDFVVFS